MPGHGAAFGRGLIIGAGAALLYAASHESAATSRRGGPTVTRTTDRQQLIDWSWATRVAIRGSGRSPALHPSAQARLQADYEALVREVEQPIADYTGNHLSLANTTVLVMDRPAWIRAMMASFQDLLQPIEDFYRESTSAAGGRFDPPPAVHATARAMLSSQVGLLVAYLARRVLGQYDLALLGAEPAAAGKLYFVEPNLRRVESTLNVPPDEFRRWIALHEATHAHEFELHPWVRTYLNTSLRRYLRLLVEDLGGRGSDHPLTAIAIRLVGNLRVGHNLVAALMTPDQRELMSRLQALMSLAEGYSNHVMNTVGRSLLPSFQLIHDRVEHRQQRRSHVELLFLRITGLSLKMEQYRLGEQFVDHVAHERGIAFANRAWDAPEMLPTEVEIREPGRWIRRMETVDIA